MKTNNEHVELYNTSREYIKQIKYTSFPPWFTEAQPSLIIIITPRLIDLFIISNKQIVFEK